MTGLPPSLERVIGLSGGALDTLMPMHIWADPDGTVIQAGPTLCKMIGQGDLIGRALFDLIDIRRPIAAKDMASLLPQAGKRLSIVLRGVPDLPLRGTVTGLPGGAGGILDISLGLSFARAVAEFELTLSDFSPCDQTIDLLYLHEANSSTAQLSRTLSERLEAARAEAEAQALTDALTGLANRRAMDVELGRALNDTTETFAVMQIDLDLFKQVNDTLGHAAGDAVLSRVGHVLRTELRHSDKAGRVGGDEFLAIIRDCETLDDLGSLARRLISELEVPIPFEGSLCKISASIGIARADQYDTRPSVDQILADTDMALYQAKRDGRGRAIFHGAKTANIPPGRRATDPNGLRDRDAGIALVADTGKNLT